MNKNSSTQDTSHNIGTPQFTVGNDVLQFFKSFQWKVVDKAQLSSSYTCFLTPDYTDQLYTKKLLDSRRVSFPEKAYTLPEDDDESTCYYIPGIEDASVVYPGNSILTNKEQILLYIQLRNIQYRTKPMSKAEERQYQQLITKAAPEHKQFQSHVQLEWRKHQYKRGLDIPASVLEFIEKLWHSKVNQCIDIYPQLYKEVSSIPLTLYDANEVHSAMKFISTLKERGPLPKMKIPSLKNRCDLETDLDNLCTMNDLCTDKEQVKQPTFKLRASQDPVVQICTETNTIDVVITPSGIKSIVDVYNCNKEWILPVTVKNILVNGEVSKKVVIVDKKLPPATMTVYEKNVWHAKIASKWSMRLKEQSQVKLDDDIPVERNTSGLPNRTLTRYEDTEEELIDSFGLSEITPSASRGSRKRRNNNRTQQLQVTEYDKEDISVKYNTSVITGVVNEQAALETEDPHIVSAMDSNDCVINEDTPSKRVKISVNDNSPSYTITENKLADKKDVPTKHHLKYGLWELDKAEHFNMSKQEQRCLKVLVRSKLDGKAHSNSYNKYLLETVFLTSKMEYQPEYGASVLSKSELVREYVDLYIRQSNLCRVRSIGHTKELMMFEMKSLADIKNALQQFYDVKTHTVFDPLYAVLTKLIDLPVGQYMLHHSGRMGAFASLLIEGRAANGLDLLKHYETLQTVDVNLPPVLIDPFTLTRLQLRNRRPPCLFVGSSTKNQLQRKLQTKKTKKKKKSKS